MNAFIENLYTLGLDAAPWLVLGLFLAGLIKAWVPQDGLARLLSGKGLKPVIMGAVVGAPLPICSCGVLPVVIGMRRAGASREATTSFLVSTPETGVDSVAISYGMFGPFMAVARPIAALFSAITTGLLMAFLPAEQKEAVKEAATTSSCGGSSCGCSGGDEKPVEVTKPSFSQNTLNGLHYAFGDIFDDIAGWLVFGLVLATAVMTWVPPMAFAEYATGIMGMVIMVIIGIPMYICATASTPVAVSLILAGVSPGAAMVFMLAGPATNVATMGIVRKEMGNAALGLYLSGIIVTSILAGLATDYVAQKMGYDVLVQMSGDTELIPTWIAISTLVVLGVLLTKKLSKDMIGAFSRVFRKESLEVS
ncbi:Permease [Candidatus Terasakiella magnetica]|uniref:Permease n=1 Tax=Candidatus Terasakiella magnetica TaxID=1867952 RepID=A0A1C3RDR9_9PROT|nr:SO_0444 family Cu/Zn efflux transporter [Candidatus Terasakiella magnetica]SCA55419.1 Permease [Candidatus Terasakiella magnetica]